MISELLKSLSDKGVYLYVEDRKLGFKLAGGSFPEDLKAAVIANKEAIIDYLTCESNISSTDNRIPRGERPAYIPLSYGQERLLYIDTVKEGSAEYNMIQAIEVDGELDIEVASLALQEIVNRHEVLRTVFRQGEDGPYQLIKNAPSVSVTEYDVSSLVPQEQLNRVEEIIKDEASRSFDLTNDLMVRVSYIQQAVAPQAVKRGVLVLVMHHIASDGWSMNILNKEFFSSYCNILKGLKNSFVELPIQYADYALWQRGESYAANLNAQADYWQNKLRGIPSVHSLPTKQARPNVKQYLGENYYCELPKEIASSLFDKAKKLKVSPFMLLHGALALVLSRHSYSNDIVVGTPSANRSNSELDNLIGFFINTLVLRINTSAQTLETYFSRVRQTHLDAQANQAVPFDLLVDLLQAPRSKSFNPLFQIMVTTNSDFGVSTPSDESEQSDIGISMRPRNSNVVHAKFDLTVGLNINEFGVGLKWTYDKALFNESYITQLNNHLCRLLEALSSLSDLTCPISSLEMLSAEESHILVDELNQTSLKQVDNILLHRKFEQQTLEYPDNIALSFKSESWTYQQINVRANQLADYLSTNHQIKPGEFVGLCAEPSPSLLIGMLAILKCQGAYVPLNAKDPSSRLQGIINDADLSLILCDQNTKEHFANFNGELTFIDSLNEREHIYEQYTLQNRHIENGCLNEDAIAYVIYTSGSTGKPKGVLQTHGNVNALFDATTLHYHFSSDDCWCLFHSIAFDFSVWEIWGAFYYGGRLLIPEHDVVSDPSRLLNYFAQSGLTVLNQTPGSFKALSEVMASQNILLPDLKYVIFGGEALLPHHLDKWFSSLQNRSSASLYNMYGITETTVHVTIGQITSRNYNNISIGKPLPDKSLFVLDSSLQPVPYGAVGELYVSGRGLAKGYLNQPELTQQRFIDNPYFRAGKLNSSKRLYKTGDLVYYNENGELNYIGRCDEQVQLRGFRVELGEIESQLNQLPQIDSSIVCVKSLAGNEHLVAYVKGHQSEVDPDSFVALVKNDLAKKIPSYMVPSHIKLVDSWPLTKNGKIDKQALEEISVVRGNRVAPSTTTQQQLCTIWCGLLGLSEADVCINDNFFELGGYSLLMMKLVIKIQSKFDIDIKLSELVEQESLYKMAQYIDNKSWVNSSHQEADEDTESFVL